MPIGIGGIGDILAIIGLVKEFALALNGAQGSAAEYQEVQRELDGLEKALLCHHQLLQARYDDPALNAIFKSTQSTAEDCKRCIEAFSQQTVKFDRSLGVNRDGNFCRDVAMKVRWQMSKKEEVVRFRAELGQHISALNMLFALANINMQRDSHEKVEVRLNSLEEKVELHSKAQEIAFTKLQEHVDEELSKTEKAVRSVQGVTKSGWLWQLVSEIKDMVTKNFSISGMTLSAIQRVEERLPSHSEMALIRSFVLEDAIGRTTRIDMLFVSSWDAFDAMLEGCFREYPGHKKVANKEYVFQDQKTNKEIKRTTPWSGALVPGQHVNMGLIFKKRRRAQEDFRCPGCYLTLESNDNGLISCKCGMSYQIRTQTVDVVEEADIPIFDLPSAPSGDFDDPSKVTPSKEFSISPLVLEDGIQEESAVEYEDMSAFKRVIVVEVEMNITQREPQIIKPTYAKTLSHSICEDLCELDLFLWPAESKYTHDPPMTPRFSSAFRQRMQRLWYYESYKNRDDNSFTPKPISLWQGPHHIPVILSRKLSPSRKTTNIDARAYGIPANYSI